MVPGELPECRSRVPRLLGFLPYRPQDNGRVGETGTYDDGEDMSEDRDSARGVTSCWFSGVERSEETLRVSLGFRGTQCKVIGLVDDRTFHVDRGRDDELVFRKRVLTTHLRYADRRNDPSRTEHYPVLCGTVLLTVRVVSVF